MRCHICDGQVVNGRCRDCGMYYPAEEGRYYLNEMRENEKPVKSSSPEKVNELNKKVNLSEQYKEQKRQSDKEEKKRKEAYRKLSGDKKSGKSVMLPMLLILVSLVLVLIRAVEKHQENFAVSEILESETQEAIENVDIYEENQVDFDYLEDYLDDMEQGDITEIVLESGEYIVGCQVPEGTYRISAEQIEDREVYLMVKDPEGEDMEEWYLTDTYPEDGIYRIEDIELHDGEKLYISGNQMMIFYSENASSDVQESMENPLTETVVVEERVQIAGEDFPAGWYDVQLIKGKADFWYGDQEGLRMDTQITETPDIYRNIYLEDGMKVFMKPSEGAECEVLLTPSEVIYEFQ